MSVYKDILINANGPVIAALVKFVDQDDSTSTVAAATTTTRGEKDPDGLNPGEYKVDIPPGIYTIQFIGSGMKKKDWLTDVIIPNTAAYDTTPPDLSSGSGAMESA